MVTGDVHHITVPRSLADEAARSSNERMKAWIAELPAIVSGFERRWSLEVGEPFQPGGVAAWVAPARDAGGRDVVLKVGWPHFEAAHEADGLRAWDGDGAARLYETETVGETTALLLERCMPGHHAAVASRDGAGRRRRGAAAPALARARAGHPFRTLQFMCDVWADGYERKAAAGRAKLDHGLARDGINLFRTLPASAEREVLLATDLHAGNVLRAEREPWLVIDPKPFVGDPTYDALQHILNCRDRLHADPDSARHADG